MLATGADVHVLRDPTRGGVAASLNEIARAAEVGIELVERHLPIPDAVRDACGLLGLDPLLRRERGQAPGVRPTRRRRPGARGDAGAPAGRVGDRGRGAASHEHPGMVVARTGLGGTRVVDLPIGEQLPRIC